MTKEGPILVQIMEHENQGQEHNLCKMQVQTKFYYKNMKITKQSCDVKSHQKFVLNKFKNTRGIIFIYTLLRTQLKKKYFKLIQDVSKYFEKSWNISN